MSNNLGGSGFQPNSGIGRDPNSELPLECITSADTYQPGVYGTFLSENGFALVNGVPHGPAMRSTTAVDLSLPDQLRFMEAWQQDELMGISYSNSIIDAGNCSLQLCPEIYQHEPDVGSSGHEHHLHSSVIPPPDDTHPASNHGIALLLGGFVNDGTVMEQQPPFPALHQDTFAPPAIVHHQERRDHDTFYQNDFTMANSLSLLDLGYHGQLNDMILSSNGNPDDILPQNGVQPVFYLQQSEPDSAINQTSIDHNFSIYNPPEAFAQNIPMNVPFVFYPEELVVIKKRNKNAARRKRPSKEDWESKKSIIKRTWHQENHTTDELIKEMAEFYNFHASKKNYQIHLASWGLWKNETKKNKGKEKYRTGDSQTRARRRPAQRRPKKRNSPKLWSAPNNTSVPMLLANQEGISMHHSKMSNAIRCMADSFFDLRRWTADPAGIILAPPPRGVDTSKVWQTLIYQSYSAATLSRMQLFKKVNLCLERFANSVDQAAKNCDPNFLIYFWRVCISLNAVRLPGKLKREPFVLLRIFLRRLERSFSKYHGSHGIIDFLRSLNQVLKDEPPKQFRHTLNRTYQQAIDNFSRLLGDGHATVLGMRRHFSFKFMAKDGSGRVCCEVDLATPYRSLLYEAELKYGQLGEQTISVLYDYASVMSPHTIDLEWVETLHERSTRFCRDQNVKTCDLATRALVFSTELLANDHISKDRNRSLEIMEDTIEILKGGDQDCQVWAKSCSKTAIMRHKKKRHKQRPPRGGHKPLQRTGEQERLVVLRPRTEDSFVVGEQPPKGHVDRQRKKNRKVCEKFQSSVFSKLKP